jgi:two-component system response regulator BaeR
MSNGSHVLIVEDEKKIAQVLADFLMADGFNTHIIQDGAEVIDYIQQNTPDMVLLDVMLPNKDGLTLCKEIRQFSELPILMLTARVEEIDRLMGLGFGADDYVCKPFSSREVVARVRAILKRSQAFNANDASGNENDNTPCYMHISINKNKFLCLVNEHKVELTPVEFNLLATLISAPGRVFSRDVLMDSSYNDARIVSHRTIDSHMKNLRAKINQYSDNDLIHTIYGVGYKLE